MERMDKHFNGEPGGIATFERLLLRRTCPVPIIKHMTRFQKRLF
jgi:hypothetical protein